METTISKARTASTAHLRILATSDLHMQLMSYDYTRDRPGKGPSLAKLATLIEAARNEARAQGAACLLFDNGDTLQGTPVADLAMAGDRKWKHPMIASMEYLAYDALGLGNHDLDHGLDKLNDLTGQHSIPVICSNLCSAALPGLQTARLLTCPLPEGPENGLRAVRVGVISSLPEKTALWNRQQLRGRAVIEPPLPALARAAAELRTQGADIIVVLAHMGIALFDEGHDSQNRLSELAALPEVDVIVGGHTHLRFPGPDHAAVREADCDVGLLRGKPLVQPGAAASDLGVIDLELTSAPSGQLRIATSRAFLRPVLPETPEDPEILRLAETAHQHTRDRLSRRIVKLAQPVNSFFALADPSPVPALLAEAKRTAVAEAMAGTAHADLPLLAAASAPLTGGFDGPDNFIDIFDGEVHMHHITGLNPYSDNVWAVKTTGARLIDWLERSALIFNTLNPDAPDQLLVDPQVPGFRFDTIYGLTYEIDPREPPLFHRNGTKASDLRGRVRNVRWNGAALDPGQPFLVATTDHRASGGGVYASFPDDDILLQGKIPLQDAVLRHLQTSNGAVSDRNKPWAFVPEMGVQAILLTAPEAARRLEDIAHLRPEPCGLTAEGFLRLRLYL